MRSHEINSNFKDIKIHTVHDDNRCIYRIRVRFPHVQCVYLGEFGNGPKG